MAKDNSQNAMVIDEEKKRKMEEKAKTVRIGGKGTSRRKKKIVHKSSAADDKKLQGVLKSLACNNIQGIEEVNIILENNQVIHFTNPKVQATVQANTFAISGTPEMKNIADLFPGILNNLMQMGGGLPKNMMNIPGMPGGLGKIADGAEDDDEIPNLVEDFDQPSTLEA